MRLDVMERQLLNYLTSQQFTRRIFEISLHISCNVKIGKVKKLMNVRTTGEFGFRDGAEKYWTGVQSLYMCITTMTVILDFM